MITIDLISVSFTALAVIFLAAHIAVDAKSIKKVTRFPAQSKFRVKQ